MQTTAVTILQRIHCVTEETYNASGESTKTVSVNERSVTLILLWNRGMGLPRFSCFHLPGQKQLASNSSVRCCTQEGGRRNLASKLAMRGHSTRGSLRSIMTRLARHLVRPHLLLYGLSLLPAVLRVKSEKGQHWVKYLRFFVGAEENIRK